MSSILKTYLIWKFRVLLVVRERHSKSTYQFYKQKDLKEEKKKLLVEVLLDVSDDLGMWRWWENVSENYSFLSQDGVTLMRQQTFTLFKIYVLCLVSRGFAFNQLMWCSPSVERELALFTSPADRIYRQLSLLTVCHKPGGNGAVVVKSTSFLFLKLFIKRHFFLETKIQFKGCAPQSLFGYSNTVNSRLLKNVNPNSLCTQFFSFNLKWEGKVFF